MNKYIEQIIDALESADAKSLLKNPFALAQYYDEPTTGIFSYNFSIDPQEAVEDVEFDFQPEYICYPVVDIKLDRDVLIFNCCDPIASKDGEYQQFKPSELMSGLDVLNALKSSPAFQDVEHVIVNVGTLSDNAKYGSNEIVGVYEGYAKADGYNVVKIPQSGFKEDLKHLKPLFKLCMVGPFEFKNDFDLYNMKWSSVLATEAYFNYIDDMKDLDARYDRTW